MHVATDSHRHLARVETPEPPMSDDEVDRELTREITAGFAELDALFDPRGSSTAADMRIRESFDDYTTGAAAHGRRTKAARIAGIVVAFVVSLGGGGAVYVAREPARTERSIEEDLARALGEIRALRAERDGLLPH